LAAVKAVTLIKQGTLMNWRRYRKALLLTGERRGIRVVRLIHPDKIMDNGKLRMENGNTGMS